MLVLFILQVDKVRDEYNKNIDIMAKEIEQLEIVRKLLLIVHQFNHGLCTTNLWEHKLK